MLTAGSEKVPIVAVVARGGDGGADHGGGVMPEVRLEGHRVGGVGVVVEGAERRRVDTDHDVGAASRAGADHGGDVAEAPDA